MRLICFNWKMQGSLDLIAEYSKLQVNANCTPVIIPPFPYLDFASKALNNWGLGAQTCHSEISGAFTGCVSAQILAAMQVSYVLIGHSERRDYEDNIFLEKAMVAAESSKIQPIICVGEKLEERQDMFSVLSQQLKILTSTKAERIIVAYEPRWAIGAGKTPEVTSLVEIFSWLRKEICRLSSRHSDEILLLYGGSLTAENSDEFFSAPGIDGGLIGGASHKIEQVREILK